MRIALINHGLAPFAVGGMEKHTQRLAENLAALGARVSVIVPDIASPHDSAGLPFQLVELPWPAASRWLQANYQFSLRAAEFISENAFDCVYAQGFNGWGYLKKFQGRRLPVIYNPHGLEMFKTQGLWQTFKHWPLRHAAREQARLADRVVSLGGKLTQEVEEFLHAKGKVVVLPNGILWHESSVPRRSLVSSANQSVRLLFVGRLQPNKGVDVLCRAVRAVGAVCLRIVGDGPLRQELERQYQSPQIKFLGALSDAALGTEYDQADGFVFASLYEGMPTVILEAFAARLPVIATDIGAVSTMVNSGSGRLVEAGNVAALAEALQWFAGLTADQRRAMGEHGANHVRERFTWPAVAKQTLEVLEAMVSSPHVVNSVNGDR